MGDRVSISFENGGEKSVTLFSHWQGMDLVKRAKEYVKELKKEIGDSEVRPLDRLEVGTVMVDFIRHLTKEKKRIEGDLYLGVDSNDGDNSDNGHHVFRLDKKPIKEMMSEIEEDYAEIIEGKVKMEEGKKYKFNPDPNDFNN